MGVARLRHGEGLDYLGDQDAIEVMAREAPDEIIHLEHIGVTFHRCQRSGELGTRAFGGASQARTYYVADITGQAILHVLYEQLLKYSDTVDRYEEVHHLAPAGRVRQLRRRDRARHPDRRDGGLPGQERHPRLRRRRPGWKPTTNGLICTGDGIGQAYRIGAPLMDMEMVQYHPTCLVENGFLITEGAREGAHLLNGDGERFMEKYAPNKLELSRDVVSRAEQTEINEGRGAKADKEGIYLDHGRAAQAHARGAPRDRQHRQGLRGRRHHPRADPHPPRPALHHGRRQDRRRRRDADRACTRRWSPASRSTAATASARTRCSTR